MGAAKAVHSIMRTVSILGILLLAYGIFSLAYFASPVRLMFQSPMGFPEVGLLPSILGGIALLSGFAVIFFVGSKKDM
jgi:hypothetical protein